MGVSLMSGGGKVHVDHAAMAAAAQRLAATRGELDSTLASIQAQIHDLVSGGFVTESASTSFAAAQERWNTAARHCVEELDVMAQYLTKTSDAFAQVDSEYTVKL
jgi:WXG100 family type VII secretion target